MTKASPADPCALTVADVSSLEILHELLTTLNDPAASAAEVAKHAERLPPLKARILRAFGLRFSTRRGGSLAERIALLGNRAFEAILLEMLEELTELQGGTTPE